MQKLIKSFSVASMLIITLIVSFSCRKFQEDSIYSPIEDNLCKVKMQGISTVNNKFIVSASVESPVNKSKLLRFGIAYGSSRNIKSLEGVQFIESSSNLNAFSIKLKNLQQKNYFIVPYAINEAGISFGEELEFFPQFISLDSTQLLNGLVKASGHFNASNTDKISFGHLWNKTLDCSCRTNNHTVFTDKKNPSFNSPINNMEAGESYFLQSYLKDSSFIHCSGAIELKPDIILESYAVIADTNGDKLINSGETATIRFFIKNIGGNTSSNSALSSVGSPSGYVSTIKPYNNLVGNIPINQNAYFDLTLVFTSFSNNVQNQAAINIQMTDAQNRSFTLKNINQTPIYLKLN